MLPELEARLRPPAFLLPPSHMSPLHLWVMATLRNYAPPWDRILRHFLTCQIVFKQHASFADGSTAGQRILIRWMRGNWTIEWKRLGVIGFCFSADQTILTQHLLATSLIGFAHAHKSRFALQVKDADDWGRWQNTGILQFWSTDKPDQTWLAAGWRKCNCCRRDRQFDCQEVDNCLNCRPSGQNLPTHPQHFCVALFQKQPKYDCSI